jgi:protein SCO1/2
MKPWKTCFRRVSQRADVFLYVIAVALFFIAHPSMLAAHSTEEVLREMQQQVPYMQLTDRAAPGFVLEDANGRKVGLNDLKGSVVVLNFIYTRCTDACPLHMTLIGQVQDQVNTTLMRDHVRFVTIATDTEPPAETAKILRTYGKAHGLDPTNWTILYGGSAEPGAGIAVAKAYGLEFTPTPDGQQMHGVVSHVIDESGVLRARFHGLKFPALTVTSFINTLLYPDHHAAGGKAVPAIGDGARQKQASRPLDMGIPFWLWAMAAAVMLGGVALVVRRMARARRMPENDSAKLRDAR